MDSRPDLKEIARLAHASGGVRLELVQQLRQQLRQDQYRIDLVKLAERLSLEIFPDGRRATE